MTTTRQAEIQNVLATMNTHDLEVLKFLAEVELQERDLNEERLG